MSKIHTLSDPNYVNQQYRNSSKLEARIQLHQNFSTNIYGWHRWLFEQIHFPAEGRVLELGCGTGLFWQENSDRIPGKVEITLSDFSEGMLKQAPKNLREMADLFQFKVVDAQSIPYDDNYFDVVIANHMLYHVPDRERAISEICRVLKPSGYLFASTIGNQHLKEIGDLVHRFEPLLNFWNGSANNSFCLENGAAQLEDYFTNVKLSRYEDSLVVTNAPMLTSYILSGRIELNPEQKLALNRFVEEEMQKSGGNIFITKDSGIFAASGKKSINGSK